MAINELRTALRERNNEGVYTAAETQGDYEIGYRKPPRHAGFQKGRSGNPKGRPTRAKTLATLLSEALGESPPSSISPAISGAASMAPLGYRGS